MTNKIIKCDRCKKEFEYTVKEYGGYDVATNRNLCKECWGILVPIYERQSKELAEFWSFKKKE